MGCHTWTYKKYNTLSKEQKRMVIDEVKRGCIYISQNHKTFDDYKNNMWSFYKKEVAQYDEDIKNGVDFGSPEEKKEMDDLMNEWRALLDEKKLEEHYYNDKKYKDEMMVILNGPTDFAYDWIIQNAKNNKYSIDLSSKVIKNVLYIEIGFDIPFRVYGYPEETFTDKKSLLNWLSKQDKKMIGYYDERNNYNWVEGYTDGLIERINRYFEENKEDTLYIEFG